MGRSHTIRWTAFVSSVLLFSAASLLAQQKSPSTLPPLPKSIRTPLPPEVLNLLANELSGQIIHNNLVKLAGAPWLRKRQEFTQTFYEAQLMHEMVREYGIATTRLEKHASTGTFDYPLEGELWILEPQRRLVARLEADPALVARGSRTADITGELIHVPPLNLEAVKRMSEAGAQTQYQGRIALLWSHPSGEQAKALAAAGIRGVIAFDSRERYFDPNQVVYASGPYDRHDSLPLGLTVSWRQWSELLEDVQSGKKVVVRVKARVEKFPDKFDTVYSWLPGTEPDAKGMVFTAHLFDGYIKRGANDNMSGCVIQLEILRALNRLIASGELPRPRRTIHFVWPQEISGMYAFLKEHPGFADGVSFDLNMDMVGEGLRKNNAVLRMGQSPGHLPTYLDGLARSLLNYVGRTNDFVFMTDVPRGRPGGQYFPIPMIEKNGSLDAFRFSIQPTMNGSDQICFYNPAVAVPGIMLLIWPDQWYHADTDTPDKADPTQLKRAAFIGAACAWAAAQCTDDVAAGLAEAASEYGYLRVAEREIPRALARLEAADAKNLGTETSQALSLMDFGAGREIGALRSIEDVFSGSPAARQTVAGKSRQWELYRNALRTQVLQYAQSRAVQLGVAVPTEPAPDSMQRTYEKTVFAIAPAVKGRQFDLAASDKYGQYMKEHPDALKTLGITSRQATTILNYVNGKRSIAEIGTCVAGELDEDVPRKGIAGYLELLRSVGWLETVKE
jgi:hypothetical protein